MAIPGVALATGASPCIGVAGSVDFASPRVSLDRSAVALVTGASRGIGRSLSLELVRAGIEVYGTGRDETALAETLALCEPIGPFYPLVADVRSEDDVARVVAEPSRLDLCINNAGIARITPFIESSKIELEELLAVNVVGAFLVMRAAAQRMVREGGGQIVTIASEASLKPIVGMAAYCASKAAVSALSQTLAEEVGPQRVQVSTVYPGPVGTEILGPVDPSWGFMDVEEVARITVSALLSTATTARITELHLQPSRTSL